jgi:Spy/CpxP family protein refolding chaperone
MKKLLGIAIATFFFAANSNAQVRRNVDATQKVQRDSTHKKRDGKMKKDMNLTQDQKTKMSDLRKNFKEQRDAIKNDASLTQEQKKTKMQELSKTQREQMKNILTPEQQQKMQAHKKEWKKHNKHNGGKMHRKNNPVKKENS